MIIITHNFSDVCSNISTQTTLWNQGYQHQERFKPCRYPCLGKVLVLDRMCQILLIRQSRFQLLQALLPNLHVKYLPEKSSRIFFLFFSSYILYGYFLLNVSISWSYLKRSQHFFRDYSRVNMETDIFRENENMQLVTDF